MKFIPMFLIAFSMNAFAGMSYEKRVLAEITARNILTQKSFSASGSAKAYSLINKSLTGGDVTITSFECERATDTDFCTLGFKENDYTYNMLVTVFQGTVGGAYFVY